MAGRKMAAVAAVGPTLINEMIDELIAALAALEPELEGLEDYRSLDLKPSTRVEIDEAIVDYNRRRELLQNGLTALEALRSDGYPALDVREISPEAYTDLVENSQTILAALAKFSSNAAVVLDPSAGTPEPK